MTLGLQKATIFVYLRFQTCTSDTECGSEQCECTAELGLILARTIIEENFQLDADHNDATDAQCIKGTGTSFSDACCGVAPSWKPYNKEVNQCSDGDIIPI